MAESEDEVSAKVLGVPFRIRGMNGINMVLLSLDGLNLMLPGAGVTSGETRLASRV